MQHPGVRHRRMHTPISCVSEGRVQQATITLLPCLTQLTCTGASPALMNRDTTCRGITCQCSQATRMQRLGKAAPQPGQISPHLEEQML
jgi:hypothetical protein